MSHILRRILGLFFIEYEYMNCPMCRAQPKVNSARSSAASAQKHNYVSPETRSRGLIHSVRTMADISVTYCENPSVFNGQCNKGFTTFCLNKVLRGLSV